STIAMTLIVLIFSEILPKSIAAKNPGQLGYFVALPLYLIHKVSTPIHFIYERTIDPLVRLIAGKQSETAQASTAEAIMKLAEGLKIRKSDGTPIPIIGSAAAAASLVAEDILISRAEIFGLEIHVSIKEAEKLLGESRYTRAIVYDESLDSVIGIVHLKDLVRANNSLDTQEVKSIEDLIKPVLFVPGKMPILSVLPRMQKGLIHTAIIQDAFGVTKGMLTQEDILEEIVGEIRDEFDTAELKRIKKISPTNYQVLGNLSLHDFNKETGWSLPGERGESISELLYIELGRAPKKDDSIVFENYALKVLDMSGKRLARIEIIKT
ncbi:hemolysin family protein, partial [Halobacteriovorax sp.]|uniref:hemolysin family protein n=1 Tax=Halobacteriovorax sp. TaxID=2020862 RepID=UPI00356305C3